MGRGRLLLAAAGNGAGSGVELLLQPDRGREGERGCGLEPYRRSAALDCPSRWLAAQGHPASLQRSPIWIIQGFTFPDARSVREDHPANSLTFTQRPGRV